MNLQANDAVAAVTELVEMGFTHDFRIRDGALIDVSADRPVDPASVEVVAKYRFETAPESGDESNIYALNVGNGQAKGFLIDALALEGDGAPQDLIARLNAADSTTQTEHSEAENTRYGVRKVRRAEFTAEPDRYVLRIGYPDFPKCPFGQGFTMLGFDTAQQEYVWLATKILRDDRLKRVPYSDDAEA